MDQLINPKQVAYVFDGEYNLCWTDKNSFIFLDYIQTSWDGWLNRYSDSQRLDGPVMELRGEMGVKFSVPVQIGPGIHPAFYTICTGSLPGESRPGSDDRPIQHGGYRKSRAVPLLTTSHTRILPSLIGTLHAARIISRRTLPVYGRVLSQGISYGICGRVRGNGTVSSPVLLLSPVCIIPPILYTQSFICQQNYVIITTESDFKWQTDRAKTLTATLCPPAPTT